MCDNEFIVILYPFRKSKSCLARTILSRDTNHYFAEHFINIQQHIAQQYIARAISISILIFQNLQYQY